MSQANNKVVRPVIIEGDRNLSATALNSCKSSIRGYSKTETVKCKLNLGTHGENRESTSEPGTRARSRKAESSGQWPVSFRLSPMARRMACEISLELEPFSMIDDSSFKTISKRFLTNRRNCKLYWRYLCCNFEATVDCEGVR